MGLMDSLKKATGVGLTPEQHYARAYEKAVLLGERNYEAAVGLFRAAAKKATEAGNSELASQAIANAAMYGFVTGSTTLQDLRNALGPLAEIAQIGSQGDTMPTAPLLSELDARLAEEVIGGNEGTTKRADGHRRAAAAFKTVFNEELWTYRYRKANSHNDRGQSRFFFHSGLAAWNDALATSMTNPDSAADHMAKALNAFRQCGDEGWTSKSETWLNDCRVRRTCWMCHREFQGSALHFGSTSAEISNYVVSAVAKLGQDTSSIDIGKQTLVLCRPCSSTVERVADRLATKRAQAVRQEVQELIQHQNNTIEALHDRLQTVERKAR
jgi:hypothetical protein